MKANPWVGLSRLAALVLVALPLAAHAVVVHVPGTSDMWLAGMPDGSTAAGGDVAPTHSPVLVSGLNLALGGHLTFTNAIGGVSNTPSCCSPIDGSAVFNHSGADENGISDVRAPINALMGVFLDASQPDLSPAPVALNFQTMTTDFLTLSPQLKQVFFIGDGMTSGAVVQQFLVPGGATRLYLGTMDGFGWFNNSGAIDVTVTQQDIQAPIPEPQTGVLMVAGLAVVAALARRRRSS